MVSVKFNKLAKSFSANFIISSNSLLVKLTSLTKSQGSPLLFLLPMSFITSFTSS
ncbi:unnamed protein product [Schistosoma mattheei]|uniref:Uncharacterized protein n=1 Tax=Schistosoma mattheei TaxID=31246 RepID=A0A3P8FZS0_9TREM|nr:unnamed protein product [Schistosoma mattheei]